MRTAGNLFSDLFLLTNRSYIYASNSKLCRNHEKHTKLKSKTGIRPFRLNRSIALSASIFCSLLFNPSILSHSFIFFFFVSSWWPTPTNLESKCSTTSSFTARGKFKLRSFESQGSGGGGGGCSDALYSDSSTEGEDDIASIKQDKEASSITAGQAASN